MAEPIMLNGEILFPSEYLTPPDLKGRDVTLTIEDIQSQDVFTPGKGIERLPVLHFKGTPKKLICRVTTSSVLRSLYGVPSEKDPKVLDIKGAKGQRITIYPTMCRVGKHTKACIRIRNEIPAEPTAGKQTDSAPVRGEAGAEGEQP